ncbi:MAG: hypothetical protein IJR59_07470 [Firmicutes bacterium]|nr:hypothetical protein [Bacillota bacterium]
MENYDYIARRNQIRAKKRTPKPKKQSYFILRLNTALALGVTVLCAKIIDLDITNAFVSGVNSLITTNLDTVDLKANLSGFITHFKTDGGISVFAGEAPPITMDDTLIAQMHEQENAYINAQKKTP